MGEWKNLFAAMLGFSPFAFGAAVLLVGWPQGSGSVHSWLGFIVFTIFLSLIIAICFGKKVSH